MSCLDLKDLKIYEGTTDKADGEVTIVDEDFYALVTKKMSLDDYISSGKAKLSGNTSALKELIEKYHI